MSFSHRRLFRGRFSRGFTVVELIAVLAVLAVLVLIAVPGYVGYTRRAHLVRLQADGRLLYEASIRYYGHHDDWPVIRPALSDDELSGVRVFDLKLMSWGDLSELRAYIAEKEGKDPSEINFYRLDGEKLKPYILIRSSLDSYVFRNPAGELYILDPSSRQKPEGSGNIVLNKNAIVNNTKARMEELLRVLNPNNINWDEITDEIESTVAGIDKVEIESVDTSKYSSTGNYIVKYKITFDDNTQSCEITQVVGRFLPIARFNEKLDYSKYNRIIYVDNAIGNDNNSGTQNSPLKTVNKAYQIATDGTLIVVGEGVYTFTNRLLNKHIDFVGQEKDTILQFAPSRWRPFDLGWGYVGINPNGNIGFYKMIIETKGSFEFANYFYNQGSLLFSNVVFRNFFNLYYDDFYLYNNSQLYIYNCIFENSGSVNKTIRFIDLEVRAIIENTYGKISYSNYGIPIQDWMVLNNFYKTTNAKLDDDYNILEDESLWKNKGVGYNNDGTPAHIGVYGGPNAWTKSTTPD
jgi:prepilin-type N-terminal cleavage/methylation domain-containing protein